MASNLNGPPGAGLASVRVQEVKPMESSDRTQDSIEQMEGKELPNPITDSDASLGEAGDAMNPEGEAPEDDKDNAEGPVPHTTQMPR